MDNFNINRAIQIGADLIAQIMCIDDNMAYSNAAQQIERVIQQRPFGLGAKAVWGYAGSMHPCACQSQRQKSSPV